MMPLTRSVFAQARRQPFVVVVRVGGGTKTRMQKSFSDTNVFFNNPQTDRCVSLLDRFDLSPRSVHTAPHPERSKSLPVTGEECYNLALSALDNAKREADERLISHAEEQWNALREVSTTTTSNKKAGGIAVIRTIVRQAATKNDKNDTTDWWNKEARRWMQEAAFRYGHARALVQLGNQSLLQSTPHDDDDDDDDVLLLLKEEAVVDRMELTQQNPTERAMTLYRWAGERGSAEGWFNLGHLLWTELENIGNDDDTQQQYATKYLAAIKVFQYAIDLGDADAMYFVGVQYLSSENDSPFLQTSGNHYSDMTLLKIRGLELVNEAAVDHGHSGALYYLALFHKNGNERLNILPCSNDEYKVRLELAANAGDADALFLLANCHYHGEDGYDKNDRLALQTFLRAANAGNSNAANSAGAMFYHGVGDGRDRRRAFELYQMAAEMGNMDGWRNLVACYALGEGVARCEKTALYLQKTMLLEEKGSNITRTRPPL